MARVAQICTTCANWPLLARPLVDILPDMRGRTTMVAAQSEDQDPASAFLLVVGRDSYATYNLPASGTLTIGRGETNAVRIDDPLASRAHACLHFGEGMLLEDLGSVNGTRIKDQPVPRGERVAIRIGDTVQIGSTVLIVQRRTAPVGDARPETLPGSITATESPVTAARGRDAAGSRAGRARGRRDHQRPHHRRDRRRQGAAGRDGAPGVAPARRPVRVPQLRGAVRDAARKRALRSRARGVHRRRAGQAWPHGDGGQRHAVPRRGRRAAAGDAGQAAARARDPRGHAPRQRAPAADGPAVHRGDEPRPRGGDRTRDVSPGPLLPAGGDHARPSRRCASGWTRSGRWPRRSRARSAGTWGARRPSSRRRS